MLHFSLESYKTVLNPLSILNPPPTHATRFTPRSQISSRDHLHSWNRIRKNKPIVSRLLEIDSRLHVNAISPSPDWSKSAPAGEWKAAVGKVPLQMECKILNCVCVCACVCICRSSWELRRSVSTTTKVPTKGFPISFNGALIATPTEGMEQPDEKGWREGPVTGAGGRKEKKGGGFNAITPARSGFQLTTGRPIVCEVSTEYRLSILLHRAGGALPRANFSRALWSGVK